MISFWLLYSWQSSNQRTLHKPWTRPKGYEAKLCNYKASKLLIKRLQDNCTWQYEKIYIELKLQNKIGLVSKEVEFMNQVVIQCSYAHKQLFCKHDSHVSWLRFINPAITRFSKRKVTIRLIMRKKHLKTNKYWPSIIRYRKEKKLTVKKWTQTE